jgi:hypothetical protein
MKINKAKIRRDIAAELALQYIESGKEWTCTACIFSLRPQALTEAKKLLANGINLSKSNYPFAYAGLMADMFLYDAAKIVSNYYYPMKQS